MKIQTTQFWNEKTLINFLLLIVISWMSIWFLRFSQTYPYGDGVEYVLMTEAIYNHGSPDIQQKDVTQYTNYLNSRNIKIEKEEVFKSVEDFLIEINSKNLHFKKVSIQDLNGFVLGKNEKFYSIHFWFYSTLAIPARALLHLLNADITKTFLLTNLCLFFIAISLIFKEKRLVLWKRISLAAFLGFSSSTWYMAWPHPELFAGVYVFMGLFYFFVERKILATLILSLVALHVPPVAFLVLFIVFNILYEQRGSWNIKLFTKLFFASVWVIFPILFSLAVFNTSNIIMAQDYLSWDVVTFRRFIGFFIDPNQGAILAIPIILLLFLIFAIIDLIKRKAWVGYYLVSSIVIMSLFFMQMKNWNHGNAVVNRYVVWVASIVTAILIFRLFKIKNKVFLISLLIVIIASQAFVITQQANYKKLQWSASYFSPFGNYILSQYPQFYNPDPEIFRNRILPLSVSTTDSVVVYSNNDNEITKMMVHTPSYRQLIARGMDSTKVIEFKDKARKFTGDWFYVNNTDFDYLNYQQSKDTLIGFIDLKNELALYNLIKSKIYNDETWYNNLVIRAEERNMPVEVLIDENVKYLMHRKVE